MTMTDTPEDRVLAQLDSQYSKLLDECKQQLLTIP